MYLEAKGKRKPIGVLMIEHRLIERALAVLEAKVNAGRPDVISFQELIDFFGTYADGTHHGKEEDILFIEADALALPEDQARVLVELRDEHVRFRGYRRAMDEANRRLARGDRDAAQVVASQAREFIPLLRQHIIKEDKIFFPGFDALQQPAERDAMMVRFQDFDTERIHETYRAVVERNE